jgi:hypothetical protein
MVLYGRLVRRRRIIFVGELMELSWLMRLRIAVAAAVGVLLLGFLAWPLVAPAEPLGVVSANATSFTDKVVLAVLACLAGFVSYFLSWPYGRQIAVLAVPSGLAVWVIRSGNMTSLMLQNPTVAQRQEVFASLRWEPIFWLALVAAGLGSSFLAEKIRKTAQPDQVEEKSKLPQNIYLNAVLALVGSGLVAQLCIGLFARDISFSDSKLGSVTAQPELGQIIFAVSASFLIAAFVVKNFLNAGYIWPIAASAVVTWFAMTTYCRQDILQHIQTYWPAVFFPTSTVAISPLQMVAFGTLGSIAGYWLAVRYNYWRKYELK